MSKSPSMLTTIIAAAAERLAQDPRIPATSREAFRETAISVMHQQWSDLFGGERVRVWTARTWSGERAARRVRILAAISTGEPAKSIARREQVSERWVQKLSAGEVAKAAVTSEQTGP